MIISLVKNFNFVRKHLGNRGLNLNEYGTSRVAMNYIVALRNCETTLAIRSVILISNQYNLRKLLKQLKVTVKRVHWKF